MSPQLGLMSGCRSTLRIWIGESQAAEAEGANLTSMPLDQPQSCCSHILNMCPICPAGSISITPSLARLPSLLAWRTALSSQLTCLFYSCHRPMHPLHRSLRELFKHKWNHVTPLLNPFHIGPNPESIINENLLGLSPAHLSSFICHILTIVPATWDFFQFFRFTVPLWNKDFVHVPSSWNTLMSPLAQNYISLQISAHASTPPKSLLCLLRIGQTLWFFSLIATVPFPQSICQSHFILVFHYLVNVCLSSRSELQQAPCCFSFLLHPQHFTQGQACRNAQRIIAAWLITLTNEQTAAAEEARIVLFSISPRLTLPKCSIVTYRTNERMNEWTSWSWWR